MDDPLLLLGGTGRIGRAFAALRAAGLWPGPPPLLAGRSVGDWIWRPGARPPRPVRAVVHMAGAAGSGDAAAATALAEEAAALAGRLDVPLLALSTAAVYSPAQHPHPEEEPLAPASAYGAAKLAMERALAGRATLLRLANVAGCDALFGAMAAGPVVLDRFADGAAPERACIGPRTLAQALEALAGRTSAADVLNLAQPGTVAMDAILAAAGRDWTWRAAPPGALRRMALDTARLQQIVALPAATPTDLVAQAREAGWGPAP